MSDDPTITGRETVSFEYESDDLTLRRLIGKADAFLGLLREVSKAALPSAGVQWLVESVSMASPFRLAVKPETSRTDVSSAQLDGLARAVAGGMQTMQRRAQRPEYFTDSALERARAIVAEGIAEGTRVRLGGGTTSTELTAQLVANIDAILGETIVSIGSVEGRLEAFNVHGANRYFNVYDALTGERIRCDFGHRIPVSAIGAAAERRVSVQGEIIYRESGEIVNVRAHSLEVFPDEADLPSADDVKGILEG